MKVSSVLAFLSAVGQSAADTNPLAKVLSVIDDLSGHVTADGEKADKAYREYAEWCSDTRWNIQVEIKLGTFAKEKLEASIAQLTADIETATSKVDDLAASISEAEKELRQASAVRKTEAERFVSAEVELVDTVDTLERALAVLQREMAKNPAAFAQIDTENVQKVLDALSAVIDAAAFSASDQSKLMALVQASSSDDDGDEGAPAASAYKSHSGNIVDVLSDMRDKAAASLSELRQHEGNAQHNFKMLKQSLEDQLAADTQELGQQKSDKAAAEEQRAIDSGDLVLTNKQLSEAESALEQTQHECIGLAADHERSMHSRKVELKVLAEAKKLLEETTSGGAEKTYSLLQVSAAKRLKIQSFIKHLAKREHSAALAQLASRVGAVMKYSHGADVFAKVKGLINDMILKLETEAAEDAKEKAFCDQEMFKTEAKKADLEDALEKLTAKIDQSASRSAELKGEVKKLQAELAALAKSQAELDKIRGDEHAAYLETKADLEKALSGVQGALGLLRDYYGSGGSDAQSGFVQQPAQPEMHSRSHGAGASIIGILEVIESDFSDNLAKVEEEESNAESDYERTSQENAVIKATKESDVKHQTAAFKSLDSSVAELSGDKETASSELNAVNEYYAQLKDRCDAKQEPYEARKKRRSAEIKGLKQALSILEDETAFMQGNLRRSHLRA